MKRYTFNMDLDATFTLEAETAQAAQEKLGAILDGARVIARESVKGDQVLGGEQVLGLATLRGHPTLAFIGDEPAPVSDELRRYVAAKDDGWLPSDDDTPEEYLGGGEGLVVSDDQAREYAQEHDAYRFQLTGRAPVLQG